MLDHSLSPFAVSGVVLLILTLAYPSQFFLIAKHWSQSQIIFFNILVACIWVTYYRCIFTDPGVPPEDWIPPGGGGADAEEARGRGEKRRLVASGTRWCKRCERFKPARCHHCKTCKKCVLKMDHHCPWTANCVGYRNFPHFLRFLSYTSFTCSYLLLHLSYRCIAVWNARKLSSYYAPHTVPQLFLLVVLVLLDAPLSLALFILWIRTVLQAAEGYTTIETWELSRHRALVRRRVARNQVFPYDIGIWENLVSAFGYQFFLPLWLNPFARSPVVGEIKMVPGVKGGIKGGLEWEVNGFEDPDLEWPPKDPEKEGRVEMMKRSGTFTILEDNDDFQEGVRRRLKADRQRWMKPVPQSTPASSRAVRRAPSAPSRVYGGGRGSGDELDWGDEESSQDEKEDEILTEEVWTNEDGERLADYGVDEELEDEDEDVPLALLMMRRRQERERVGGVLKEVSSNAVL